jgi:flagellin
VRNANDGISLAQTAEGALQSSSNILQRMRVLAVQAANDTYSTVDRKAINNEIIQLKQELNRGVNQASFNGSKILDGTNASFTFQVGHKSGDNVVVTLGDMRGSEIGTRDWDPKAAVTAPVTASAVAAVTTAVPEIDTYTLGSPTSGTLSFAYGGTTYSAAFNSTSEQTLIDLKTAINDGAAGSSVTASTTSNDKLIITADVASATQMTKGTITGGSTITIADTAVGAALTGEQESYDFSSITLAQGDRVSLTIGTTTYTQEFTADQATTLSALGAKVVNGDASYVSKAVDTDGKLVFTGAAIGTALAAATTAVETSSVAAANSVDDILVTDAASAKAALAVVDSALEMMSDFRARLGASSNRMFITVDNLMSMSENTAAARSRIVDADFAAESASLAKSQILQKAGTAMLSQANASTQDILSLLK